MVCLNCSCVDVNEDKPKDILDNCFHSGSFTEIEKEKIFDFVHPCRSQKQLNKCLSNDFNLLTIYCFKKKSYLCVKTGSQFYQNIPYLYISTLNSTFEAFTSVHLSSVRWALQM